MKQEYRTGPFQLSLEEYGPYLVVGMVSRLYQNLSNCTLDICTVYCTSIPQCDIMIYKKYIFGQSDDQSIFLTCIWACSQFLLHSSGNSWNFLGVESEKGGFCYGNEVAFGKPA